MLSVQQTVQRFFTVMGVDLTSPGKTVFFNDRDGTLFARATLQDLDIIETAVQVLNIAPPEVNIKAKFIEVSQNDSRALGFQWYLGNVLMNNGSIIRLGGPTPHFTGAPRTGQPPETLPPDTA